jgi:hypothetical protein
MIRYLGINGINLDTFQEDFDLQLRGEGDNSFVPIADRIKERYSRINIKVKDFSNGNEKVAFLKQLIKNDIPCAISIAKADGGWHIAPIVAIDDNIIKVIWVVNTTGNQPRDFIISDVVFRHNNWGGGKDIAWVEK